MTIDASAIISNSSANGGDGIYNNSTLVISNSTISNNTGFGFGIYNASALTLTNVTLNSNLLNLVNAGDARLHNTFVANSTFGNNCNVNPVMSLGHNLSSDGSCNLNASGDLTNTNPLLGPLQDNGGPTPTNALLPGSPAINASANTGCPATDRRGVTRPQAVICDIGAYEVMFTETLFLPVVPR